MDWTSSIHCCYAHTVGDSIKRSACRYLLPESDLVDHVHWNHFNSDRNVVSEVDDSDRVAEDAYVSIGNSRALPRDNQGSVIWGGGSDIIHHDRKVRWSRVRSSVSITES